MTRLETFLALTAAVSVTTISACAQAASAPAPHPPATSAVTAAAPSAAQDSTAPAKQPARASMVRLSAVGDTILGNTPDVPSDPVGYLHPIAKALRWRADIVFGNLEGTLTTATGSKCGGSSGGDCYAFRNPPAFAKAFAKTGFTVLNDANNHSHDFGEAGLRQTIHAIHHAGMQQTGLPGQITIVKAGRVKVGMVAFAPYTNTADLLDLKSAKALIKKADRKSNLVVVYMHAGAEGADADHVTGHEEHYVGEDRGNPEKFAHMAIRAGADLVIASGPHVMRGMQFFHGDLIAYSLGNFSNFNNFGGGGDLTNSGILHVTLTSTGKFVGARLVSAQIASEGQAHVGGDSVRFVRGLSKDDFGPSAARFDRSGRITAPRH